MLKLHGSVDWFDRKPYRELVEQWERDGHSDKIIAGISDPIFNSPCITTVPITIGPRFPLDPLAEIHRVKDVDLVYCNPPFLIRTPVLVPPSNTKMLSSVRFSDFWQGLDGAGTLNFRMWIIGYSLAPADSYVHQAIYKMVTNYQEAYCGEDISGKRKEPLVLIDRRPSDAEKEEYHRAYRFVNRERTIEYLDGFDATALEAIAAAIAA